MAGARPGSRWPAVPVASGGPGETVQSAAGGARDQVPRRQVSPRRTTAEQSRRPCRAPVGGAREGPVVTHWRSGPSPGSSANSCGSATDRRRLGGARSRHADSLATVPGCCSAALADAAAVVRSWAAAPELHASNASTSQANQTPTLRWAATRPSTRGGDEVSSEDAKTKRGEAAGSTTAGVVSSYRSKQGVGSRGAKPSVSWCPDPRADRCRADQGRCRQASPAISATSST
jgi:hypothetical protein